jgi:hypothetical protein
MASVNVIAGGACTAAAPKNFRSLQQSLGQQQAGWLPCLFSSAVVLLPGGAGGHQQNTKCINCIYHEFS